MTREKYQKRLERFFDFLGLEGSTVEEKSKVFMEMRRKDGNQCVFNSLLRFMQFYLARVDRKEITGATVRNYLKSIKLLCEMADIPITWKRITKGLPKEGVTPMTGFPQLMKYENCWSTQTGESRPLCMPWPLQGFGWAPGTI